MFWYNSLPLPIVLSVTKWAFLLSLLSLLWCSSPSSSSIWNWVSSKSIVFISSSNKLSVLFLEPVLIPLVLLLIILLFVISTWLILGDAPTGVPMALNCLSSDDERSGVPIGAGYVWRNGEPAISLKELSRVFREASLGEDDHISLFPTNTLLLWCVGIDVVANETGVAALDGLEPRRSRSCGVSKSVNEDGTKSSWYAKPSSSSSIAQSSIVAEENDAASKPIDGRCSTEDLREALVLIGVFQIDWFESDLWMSSGFFTLLTDELPGRL